MNSWEKFEDEMMEKTFEDKTGTTADIKPNYEEDKPDNTIIITFDKYTGKRLYYMIWSGDLDAIIQLINKSCEKVKRFENRSDVIKFLKENPNNKYFSIFIDV